MAYKKYIGFEIETIYNSQLLNLDVGEYHDGVKCGKFWSIENDASINTRGNTNKWSNWANTAEFVSVKLDSKNKIEAALKEFKDLFSKKGKLELNETLFFNSSVGLHLHISFSKDNQEKRFNKYIDPSVFKKLRRRLFKDIKNSNVKSKEEILKNYFRHYALKTKFDENGSFRNNRDKYQEFNFYSEQNKQGLEWRSPNLNGVTTWEEFNFMINLYLKYANFMLKKLISNKTQHKHFIEIEEKENTPIEIKLNVSVASEV